MAGGDFEDGAETAEAAGRRRRLNVGQVAGWPNAAWARTRWVFVADGLPTNGQ
jgi:hypothetical protein